MYQRYVDPKTGEKRARALIRVGALLRPTMREQFSILQFRRPDLKVTENKYFLSSHFILDGLQSTVDPILEKFEEIARATETD